MAKNHRDMRGHCRLVRRDNEQKLTVVDSDNISRLHFSRESTDSSWRAPVSLWSEP